MTRARLFHSAQTISPSSISCAELWRHQEHAFHPFCLHSRREPVFTSLFIHTTTLTIHSNKCRFPIAPFKWGGGQSYQDERRP
ncbi:1-phosphatidylinositol 4,5-bisphosphate phosphodiesterase eta-2 [Lates japonicus]